MLAVEEMAEGWNIFARVLAGLLAKRSVGMTDLYHAGIYREEVRRLRRSLKKPGTFPVLNPAELQRISAHYHLTPEEIWRLRAAVVATAVQRLLYGRISPDDSRLAALEIYPILLEAIGKTRVSPVWRHDQDDQSPSNPAATDDEHADVEDLDLPDDLANAAAEILDLLEDGALALNLSVASYPVRERIRWARLAQSAFAQASAALLTLPPIPNANADEMIVTWTMEAQHGAQAAAARLAEFSNEPQ